MSEKKPTIAIVLANGSQGKGGIERSTLYIIRKLKHENSKFNIVEQRSRIEGYLIFKHITTAFFLCQFAVRLTYIDVVHINIAPRGSTFRKILFALVAKLFGKKVIIHLHGGGYDAFFDHLPSFAKNMVRWLFCSADAVVILGEHSRAFVVRQLRVLPDRIFVIGNGVPPAETLANPIHNIPNLCFMGRLIQSKGVDILISALGVVKRRGVPFRTVIGGNGDIAAFKQIARHHDVDEEVQFLGWLGERDVMNEYSHADIFVLPSLVENQPMSILEAMAHGLPVVATRVGAIPQQIVDGVSGFIVPPGDTDALADALERLCRDSELRLSMGKAGYKRWETLFSVDAAASRIADLYHSMEAN